MKHELNDERLEEIASGLMEQFRIVMAKPGDVEIEMKIYDSMANGAGKILKAYMVDIATNELSAMKIAQKDKPLQIEESTKLAR